MECDIIFGPNNRCRNGDCDQLVELCSRFQHYCSVCSYSSLGLDQTSFVITLALQRRRKLLTRLLRGHRARLPPCVVGHILDHVMNDVGYVSPSRRWACVMMRSRVLG